MAGPPYIHSDGVTIYYTEDSHLSRVLVFYWPVTTAGSSVSSRHRVTILTKIGHASFPPFQVSPQSSYYGAVAQLTDHRQRDEIYRVMVFSLAKYFDTLPAASKENGYDHKTHNLYDDRHAGAIANKLFKVTNPLRVIEDVLSFYSSSTKLQQTTTRPTSSSRSTTFSSEQKQAVRLAMCEVVDTEERYVSKMHELLSSIIAEFREKSCTKPATASTSPSDEAVSKLFPSCLDAIFTVNRGFLDSIRHVLETTEDSALDCIATSNNDSNTAAAAQNPSQVQDPLGIRAFSKVLTTWFPKFLYPYREYLYAHTTFSPILTSLMKNHSTSSFSRRVRETGGEQRLRSILMEPVQRLPRYSLLIDSMTQPLPAVGEEITLKLLAKARDVIAEICAMETPVSKVLEALTISYQEEAEKKEGGYIRSLSPAKFFSSRAAAQTEEQHLHPVALKNVPRLVAPGDDRAELYKDRDRERGREKPGGGAGLGASLGGGGGGSLRRAWSRRASPPKREQPHQQQVMKENLVPSRSIPPLPPLHEQQQQQKKVQDHSTMATELDKLRRENATLRNLLDRCTCGAGSGLTAAGSDSILDSAGGSIARGGGGGGGDDDRRIGGEYHRSF